MYMKLLDQVRQKLRAGHFAYRTEQSYVRWIEKYIRCARRVVVVEVCDVSYCSNFPFSWSVR